jgi:hypothetical protein
MQNTLCVYHDHCFQQAELSTAEMVAAVPSFLRKISLYRPRIVCFIGLGIWKVVQAALSKALSSPQGQGREFNIVSRSQGQASTTIGLQSYMLVYPQQENLGAS